jgi:hypothetical protein
MDSPAKAKAMRHHCGLQLCAFSGRMGGNVAGDCDQDVTSRRAPTPLPVLLHASLKHLVRVELGILAKHCARKCGDQRLRRMTEDKMSRNEAAGPLNLSLSIERYQKCIAQFAAVSR